MVVSNLVDGQGYLIADDCIAAGLHTLSAVADTQRVCELAGPATWREVRWRDLSERGWAARCCFSVDEKKTPGQSPRPNPKQPSDPPAAE